MASNVRLNSPTPVSSDGEAFYRDYWQPHIETGTTGNRVKDRRDFITDTLLGGPLSGKTLLEIGVGGEGGIIASLHKENAVYGVDVSTSALIGSRSLGLSVEKVDCDREHLPFLENFFDIVIALEVFEHFSNPQFALEQIRRVLKPNGILLASTPSPYTYHWPRLFYPSLFERVNFQDFLLVNELVPTIHGDPLFSNVHSQANGLEIIDRSHSYYWKAVKVADTDAERLYDVGKYLFERKDHLRIRIRPVDALDILKKSIAAGNSSTEALRDYMCALVYRVINGDSEEFLSRMQELIEMIEANPDRLEYVRVLLAVHEEAESLGKNFLDRDLLMKFACLPGLQGGEH